MKTVLIAAAFALAASSAFAAGPYHLDAGGKCRDDKGWVKPALCPKTVAHSYKLDAKGKCRDEKGHFAKDGFCHK
jgi:hypothetical protein